MRCAYCGATNKLTRGFAPPPGPPWTTSDRGGRAGLVVALTLLLVIIGVSTFVGLRRPAMLTEWYSVACPVDADGDGVLDFVGFGGWVESRQLMIVDGSDGSILWRSDSKYGLSEELFCLGDHAFGVASPDARVTVFDPRARAPRWSLPLPDKLGAYGVAGDCLELKTIDDQELSVGLTSGSPRRCDAPMRPLYRHELGRQDKGEAFSLEAEGVTYRVHAKTSGTPVLTVAAERGGQPSWETPLRYAAVDGALFFARAPRMLLTYGVDPAQTNNGVLIGIDPETGRVRYEARQRSTWSVNFARTFVFNGRYLVTTWGFGLHAYDPTTGERVWNIGGR